MDTKLLGTSLALFLLGIAYGFMITLYTDMVRYRVKEAKARKNK